MAGGAGEVPCLSASPLRSTPGPLPYQIEVTPSSASAGDRRASGAHVRRGGQFLVARRQERHIVTFQQVRDAGEGQIEPGER